jgi:hypothetical protein
MRRSGVRFPEAALKKSCLASGLFRQRQCRFVGPVQQLFGPHLVRIQFCEGTVEPVRNGIKIVGEESGVHIECHGRRCVLEPLLHDFGIGARCHGEAELLRTANVYSDGHSEEILGRAPVPVASFPIQMIDVSKAVSIPVLIRVYKNPPRPVGATLQLA